jgi:hypothetical protein
LHGPQTYQPAEPEQAGEKAHEKAIRKWLAHEGVGLEVVYHRQSGLADATADIC